ncbi:hypothetical protein WG954_16525 [Lacibacter sp. H375]|uniref:hypothetical protein n=1 Tax=Lacibacter sp. H375 TaxID=3133424 RepID=UPI0030C3D836
MKLLSTATITLFLFSCSTQKNKLDSKVLTEEFHYIMWACECANWATLDAIQKYEGDSLASHCVFIEPADSSLILSDTLEYTGDIVQFTGQYYVDKGYPDGFVKDEQQVDKAKVFRYTSYKIVKSNYSESIADQIDTAKYLVEKGSLSGQPKTLDVSYAAIMCTCPQWFETKYSNDTFNIEHFYLEPASNKIPAANKLYNGTNIPLRISVTGQFYSKKGYPANYFPTKGDPEPAKVFRYDKIKIIQNGSQVSQKNGL